MHKSTRKFYALMLTVAALAVIVLCALRILALRDYEAESTFFAFGALLPSIIHYALFAIVLLFLVGAIFLRGRIHPSVQRTGILYFSMHGLLGTSLAAYALFEIPHFFEERAALDAFAGASEPLLILTVVFALFSVFFCIHNALYPDAAVGKRVTFGLAIPIFAIVQILFLYFEPSMAINSPVKLLDQFTFGAIALYFLYELRTFLGTPRHALHAMLGLICMVFTAVSSIPAIVHAIVYDRYIFANQAHDMMMLGFCIYTAYRSIALLVTVPGEADEIAKLLEEAEHAPTESRRALDPTVIDDPQLAFDLTDLGDDREENTEVSVTEKEEAIPAEEEETLLSALSETDSEESDASASEEENTPSEGNESSI